MRQRQRLQVGGVRDPGFRPGTTAVDTFVTPSGGHQIAQLAAGLSQFAPSLAKYSDLLHQERVQKDTEAGALAARQEYEREFAEKGEFTSAIEQGLIGRNQSPYFMRAYKQTLGRIAADRYSAALKIAMDDDEGLRESVEAADFDRFEAQFRQQWLAENIGDHRDGVIEGTMGPQLDNYVAGLRREWAAGAGQRIQKHAGDAYHSEAKSIALRASAEEYSAEDLAQALITRRDEMIEEGMVGKRAANDLTVDALINAAEDLGDASILDAAEHITTRDGAILARTKENSAKLRAARDSIVQRNERDRRMAEAQEDRRRVEQAESILSPVFNAMVEAGDPHAVGLDQAIAELTNLGTPEGRTAVGLLLDFRATLSRGRYEESPLLMGGLTARASAGQVSEGELRRLVAQAKITPQQFSFLMSQRDAWEAGLPKPTLAEDMLRQVDNHPVFMGIRRQIEASFGPMDALDEESGARVQEIIRGARVDFADWYHNQGGRTMPLGQVLEFEQGYVPAAMERYRPAIEAALRENPGEFGSPREAGRPTTSRTVHQQIGAALQGTGGNALAVASAARLNGWRADPQEIVDAYNENVRFYGGEPIELQPLGPIVQSRVPDTPASTQQQQSRTRITATGRGLSPGQRHRIESLDRRLEAAHRELAEAQARAARLGLTTNRNVRNAEAAIQRIEAELESLTNRE